MSEPRSPLGPSLPSVSPPSSSSIVVSLAKRRAPSSSTLEFFATAAKSFQPLPYTPHAPYGQSETRAKGFPPRHQSRPHDSLAIPGMDPQLTDPDVVFIHPPFATFPNSERHPEGLSYQVMANNPEWFLDPNDFISPSNPNPQAVAYPTILEPPRGWCPAKKKDLKERGGEGWPEGEEPRLRCTFCRRTYAGVNAKSMWRRHVYEKHKIAMSNRRDGNDRPRGRGTGKENKKATSVPREEPHDRVLSLQVAPQTELHTGSHKSRFRSTFKPTDLKGTREKKNLAVPEPNPVDQTVHPSVQDDPQRVGSDTNLPSPPPSPQTALDSDADVVSKLDATDTPSSPRPPIPASPYNPLTAPSFRHSPPRLPSDRPWRFGTPSHPLHSATRDLSLTMLVQETNSPLANASIGFGSSPLVIRSSPLSTPNESLLKTPSTSQFSAKGFPRSWVVKGPLGSPLEKHSQRPPKDFSPLSRGSLGSSLHRKTPSRPDDWLSGDLDFAQLQSPWQTILADDVSPSKRPRSFIEPESPVVRRATSSGINLGIGLMDPFVLTEAIPSRDDIEAEINAIDEGAKRDLTINPRKQAPSGGVVDSPPLKKRRVSLDG